MEKQLAWNRPVQKNGTVSIPKPILDALGNPKNVVFVIEGNQVVVTIKQDKNNELVVFKRPLKKGEHGVPSP